MHVVLVPAGAQAPAHPAKLLPAVAPAVSVSWVPSGNVSVQSPLDYDVAIEQLSPVPLTVPVPPLFAAARMVTV
jgi:hypothetical protein